MGTARQDRGKRTNVVVAAWLRARGWKDAEATVGAETGQDVKHVPGHSIEVKARAKFDPAGWLRQAKGNARAGQKPCVIMRCNGTGERAEDYLVIRRLCDDELNRTRFGCGEGCTGYNCSWCASTSDDDFAQWLRVQAALDVEKEGGDGQD